MINSEFNWSNYLYEGIEILLITIRGNHSAFFTMGVADDVRLNVSYYVKMFLELLYSSCICVLEKPYNLENPRLIEVASNTLASLLSTYS